MTKDNKKEHSTKNMEQEKTIELQEELLAESLNTDENRAGIAGLEEELNSENDSKIQEELTALNDKYLRLAAEFDNYKRRTSRERVELLQTAGKEIVTALLEVLDDTDRAAKSLETDDVAQIKDGVGLVFSKLRNTLQAKGLKPMEALGADFDPGLHDAITEIPAPGQEGKVVDVVTPGYFLNDKIIRHAKVVVGK